MKSENLIYFMTEGERTDPNLVTMKTQLRTEYALRIFLKTIS